MTITPLTRRLARIEASRQPSTEPLPCTVIVCENHEDRDRQLAEHKAAGTYKPGWPVIAWMVVDPQTRPPTERSQ